MISTAVNDRFGEFGGRYVPETLIPALDELDAAFNAAMADEEFTRSVDEMPINITTSVKCLFT